VYRSSSLPSPTRSLNIRYTAYNTPTATHKPVSCGLKQKRRSHGASISLVTKRTLRERGTNGASQSVLSPFEEGW
jgi:hypothetical protein